MKNLLLSLLLLLPIQTKADPISVCLAMKALYPPIQDDILLDYSETIDKLALEYKVDWKVIVAIFRQESNFDLKAVNYNSKDFGIGQLNYKTIKDRNIDLGSLLTDKEYAMRHTINFLSELQEKYAKLDSRRGQKWYTRYHSFVNSTRNNYRDYIKKHLRVIEVTVSEYKQSTRRQKASYQRTVCEQGSDDRRDRRGIPSSNGDNLLVGIQRRMARRAQ